MTTFMGGDDSSCCINHYCGSWYGRIKGTQAYVGYGGWLSIITVIWLLGTVFIRLQQCYVNTLWPKYFEGENFCILEAFEANSENFSLEIFRPPHLQNGIACQSAKNYNNLENIAPRNI